MRFHHLINSTPAFHYVIVRQYGIGVLLLSRISFVYFVQLSSSLALCRMHPVTLMQLSFSIIFLSECAPQYLLYDASALHYVNAPAILKQQKNESLVH